jgi:hypothetical protein
MSCSKIGDQKNYSRGYFQQYMKKEMQPEKMEKSPHDAIHEVR